MTFLTFRRTLACLIGVACALSAGANTVLGSKEEGTQRPPINDITGDVAFIPDNFDYSMANLSQFTYTYEDESGQSVTVPLTTPATTREAMIALLREVYTNPAIPGRKWVQRAGEYNVYVDYAVAQGSIESELYGIPAGDYTPNVEGETCLLVEGIDSNEPPQDGDEGFLQFKRITLISDRCMLADNSNPRGFNNPGYMFNVSRPLYKFFFISKGKARSTHNYPFGQLFEEYSPNEETHGIDQTKTDVYSKLLTGTPYYVRHDCSSVVFNPGHIMAMGSLEDATPADISLSVFLPFYRSYDDESNPPVDYDTEPYTWYDPDHRPFFYHYSINLDADVEVDETTIDETGYPTTANVTLNWSTNFRSRLFNTAENGEFRAYKVVNGAIDRSNPILFTSTPQSSSILSKVADPDDPERMISISNPYEQITAIDGERVVSNYDNAPVAATYQEPILDEGRYVTYVVYGRQESSESDPTQSNTARVYIPGRNELKIPGFNIAIDGEGTSYFSSSDLENQYSNPIVLTNRSGALAIKGDDIHTGGVFTLYRTTITDGAASSEPIATITVEAMSDGSFTTEYDQNGQVSRHWRLRYFRSTYLNLQSGATDPNVRWKSVYQCDYAAGETSYSYGPILWHAAINTDGTPMSDMAIDDFSPILARLFDDHSVSTSLNSHPDAYQYYMVYTEADQAPRRSNIEDVTIFKSSVTVSQMPLSFDDILSQEDDYMELFPTHKLSLTIHPDPEILYYRVRFTCDDEFTGSPRTVALVQNYNNRLTISIPDEEGNFIPLDEQIDVAEQGGVIEIPLTTLRSDYAEYIAAGEPLVADLLRERSSSGGSRSGMAMAPAATYNTYGGPITTAKPQPQLYITDSKFGDFTESNECPRLTNFAAAVEYENAIPDGYEALGISHFTIWRYGVNPGEPSFPTIVRYNDYNMAVDGFETQTLGFRQSAPGLFKHLQYYSEDNSRIMFAEGMSESANSASYTVRAYVAIVPAIGEQRSRVSAADPRAITYLPAESSVLINYNRDFTVTGVEDVAAESAQVEYYNLQGARVANPSTGVYIRRQGDTTTKIFVK